MPGVGRAAGRAPDDAPRAGLRRRASGADRGDDASATRSPTTNPTYGTPVVSPPPRLPGSVHVLLNEPRAKTHGRKGSAFVFSHVPLPGDGGGSRVPWSRYGGRPRDPETPRLRLGWRGGPE